MSPGETRHFGAENHYAVLGVAETATVNELRRAYRRLALCHHPDRAGPEGEATFIRISVAYRVLSSATSRAEYDQFLKQHGRGDDAGIMQVDIGPDGRPSVRQRRVLDRLPRVSGPLAELIRRGAVEVDGAAERSWVFRLTRAEMALGGTAVVTMPLAVRCPTCGGISRPHGVWCRTCEFKGAVVEHVAVLVPVPPEALPGTVLTIDALPAPSEPIAATGVTSKRPALQARPMRFRFERIAR